MTQEDRELLLKDLSSRLSYEVRCKVPNGTGIIAPLKGIVGATCYFNCNPTYGASYSIEHIKPYLRPMSSMTEDERQEARDKFFAGSDHYDIDDIGEILADTYQPYESVYTLSFPRLTGYIDWLFAHHFDIHDLIKKGLAIEAPEGMYA